MIKRNFEVGRWYSGVNFLDGGRDSISHFLVIDRSANEIVIIKKNDDDFIDMKKAETYRLKRGHSYIGYDCEYFHEKNFGGHSLCYLPSEIQSLSDYTFKY